MQNHQIYPFDISTIPRASFKPIYMAQLKYRMITTSQRTFLYMLIHSQVLGVIIIWIVFFLFIYYYCQECKITQFRWQRLRNRSNIEEEENVVGACNETSLTR